MNYSNEDLSDMHLCYGEANCSKPIARDLYKQKFPERDIPDDELFAEVHKCLREHGNFDTLRNEAVQKIATKDRGKRLVFCRWFADQLENHGDDFVKRILFTDEHTFKSKGCHTYSQNVWAGIVGNVVIGPVFINASFTIKNYLQILKKELPKKLTEIPMREQIWFMHDGAPQHKSKEIQQLLSRPDYFGNQWIGEGGQVLWPPRSGSELNPMDFYVWKYIDQNLKGFMDQHDTSITVDFKTEIKNAFDLFQKDSTHSDNIKQKMISRVRTFIKWYGGK